MSQSNIDNFDEFFLSDIDIPSFLDTGSDNSGNNGIQKFTQPVRQKPQPKKKRKAGEMFIVSKKLVSKKPNPKSNYFYNTNILSAIQNRSVLQGYDKVFSHEVKPELTPCNQKYTGTCWMMACFNVIRQKFIKDNNLPKTFQFSKAHLFFWDKIERCNFYLHKICDLKDKDLKDLDMVRALRYSYGDGGDWSLFVNLVEKYGLMPEETFPNDRVNDNSRQINYLLKKELRYYAKKLRDYKGDSYSLIPKIMKKLVETITTFMGTPPEKFIWRVKDSKTDKLKIHDTTPEKFFKDIVKFKFDEYVCISSNPKQPTDRVLRIVQFGNNVEKKDSYIFLNVGIQKMVNMARKSIMDNECMYFGCNVVNDLLDKVMDDTQFDYDMIGLNYHKRMNRKDMFEYDMTHACHAMVLRGVDIKSKVVERKRKKGLMSEVITKEETNTIVKWKVENSWGTGEHYVMTHKWFLKNATNIVVKKKYLEKRDLDRYEKMKKNKEFVDVYYGDFY